MHRPVGQGWEGVPGPLTRRLHAARSGFAPKMSGRLDIMKSRTCDAVSGQIRRPARSLSTKRPLLAAKMPKRCSPSFSAFKKQSISERRVASIGEQFTRYRVHVNTRQNVQPDLSASG